MILREAKFDDWEILLKWRNDPTARENSFNQNEISELNHKLWFMDSLMNDYRKIYILEENSTPVGTIRVDKIDLDKYILSWNISPDHRKKGYGVKILEIYLENKTGEFIAEIKPENIASIKMVEKNKFEFFKSEDNKLTFRKIQQ
jgi:RimJ/RimL family protein N-acetyltransferase